MPIIILVFCLFLTFFMLVGLSSSRYKTKTTDDYLVASRNVNPWMIALSAISTKHSGFIFIGLIGSTYRIGFQTIWFMLGILIGDIVCWFWFHSRVRRQSEEVDSASLPTLLGTSLDGSRSRPIIILAGVLTFIFLGIYAAAQFKAGSAALESLFGWPSWAGAVIGSCIVFVYCFSGGLRASIWTDTAQSIVMLGSMFILTFYCMSHIGSPITLASILTDINPELTTWFPENLPFGFVLYFLGFLMGGVGVVAQPHIMVRFMAVRDEDALKKTALIYCSWSAIFSTLAVLVGLYSRALLPELTLGLEGAEMIAATERALPELSLKILPNVLVGVMLAGLFSATMSTADSQVLACSAAITQSIVPRYRKSYLASKVATLSVTIFSLLIALYASSGVFSIVLLAWSSIASMFTALLFVRLANLPLNNFVGILMILSGLATVIIWTEQGYGIKLFSALPGICVPSIIYIFTYFIYFKKLAPKKT